VEIDTLDSGKNSRALQDIYAVTETQVVLQTERTVEKKGMRMISNTILIIHKVQ
jgi:hypothetical protein